MFTVIRPPQVKLLLSIIIISSTLFYRQSYSSSISLIIKEFCLEEFTKETINHESMINNKIGEFTCDCFVDKMNVGSSIKDAKKICKDKASKEFNL